MVVVDQTQEAQLQTVNVDVSAGSGQTPKFDIDVADVSVGSTEVGVAVPNVDVKTETRTIIVEVPVVDAETEEKKPSLPTIEIVKPAQDNPANNPNQSNYIRFIGGSPAKEKPLSLRKAAFFHVWTYYSEY